MHLRVALNIPDCHIPFHDKAAYDCMLECAKQVDKQYGIEEVNIMGDYLDFLWVSLHSKLPELMSVKETFKDEIYQGNKKLQELRTLFPKATINFIEGNHEYRLVRYLVAKCPELFDIITLQELLKFDEYNITYHPFGKNQLVQCLGTDYYLRHQPWNGGKHCAANSLHNKHISLGFGHTHRTQTYKATDPLGRRIQCRSLGWLGDRSSPVFSYVDHDNWTQGFEFAYQLPDAKTSEYWLDYVEVINGECLYQGFLYTGDDR
jgi:hypothetical protein